MRILVIGAVAAGTSAATAHRNDDKVEIIIYEKDKDISSKEVENLINEGEEVQIVDARVNKQYNESHVDTAINISHSNLRDEVDTLNKDILTITYCNKGVTGNATQNILINHGFKEVYNLSGGHKFYKETK
nr:MULTISPECIES: rhodanese-like domain-containing protein [unclassified Clostridium]